MKTILIPVDFSEASKNVLQYMAGMAKDIIPERIILLRSFHLSVYAQLLPSADFVQISAEEIELEKESNRLQLQALATGLAEKIGPAVKVETALSEMPLLRAINSVLSNQHCDLLLIGSAGKTYFDNNDIQDHVVAMAKLSQVPVLIIPCGASYNPIRSALVPCDFSAISSFNLLKNLHRISLIKNPDLMVLNVDPHEKNIARDDDNQQALKDLLENYQYKVFYLNDTDTIHGILDFANSHAPDLLIALPGKHSIFYRLTHRSITEALSLNARQPVLILK